MLIYETFSIMAAKLPTQYILINVCVEAKVVRNASCTYMTRTLLLQNIEMPMINI